MTIMEYVSIDDAGNVTYSIDGVLKNEHLQKMVIKLDKMEEAGANTVLLDSVINLALNEYHGYRSNLRQGIYNKQ